MSMNADVVIETLVTSGRGIKGLEPPSGELRKDHGPSAATLP
jgi:hypothetical protein